MRKGHAGQWQTTHLRTLGSEVPLPLYCPDTTRLVDGMGADTESQVFPLNPSAGQGPPPGGAQVQLGQAGLESWVPTLILVISMNCLVRQFQYNFIFLFLGPTYHVW